MFARVCTALAGSILFTLSGVHAQVVINEVVYDGPGSDNGQTFIELFGPPGTDISGWTVASIEGGSSTSGGSCNTQAQQIVTFGAGTTIPNDGLFVLADDDGTGATQVANADLIDFWDPENGADAIVLADASGNVVDAVAYGAINTTNTTTAGCAGINAGQPWFEGNPARDVFAPLSLERCPAGADTGDNDTDFTPNVPSPGVAQRCCNAIEFVSQGVLNNLNVAAGDAVGLDVWQSCSSNQPYIILWSFTDPGSALVPIVPDAATGIAAGLVNIPPFIAWFGTLDAQGRLLGTASMDWSGLGLTLGVPGPVPTWVSSAALSLSGLQQTNNVQINLN